MIVLPAVEYNEIYTSLCILLSDSEAVDTEASTITAV